MITLQNGSLIKAFALLDLISDQQPEITAAIVARDLDMSPATAHRYLATLDALGILSAQHRGVYGLGHRIVHLGQIAERTNPLKKLVLPIIERLSLSLGESVMAGRPAPGGIVCMATASAPRPISVHIQVGRQLGLTSSAQGKVWLAHQPASTLATLDDMTDALRQDLQRIRVQGFARNRGEAEPDIGAVAVPVINGSGEVALTLSVFGMISRFSDNRIEVMVAGLTEAASEVATALPDV